MIYIKRNFASLEIEIEIRGSQIDEKFYIPMELITSNMGLNETFMAFRNLGHGDPDCLRMSISFDNQAAMHNLRRIAFEVQCTHITERIVRTSVLA